MTNLLKKSPLDAFPEWTRLKHLGQHDTKIQQHPPKSLSICFDSNGSEKKCEIILYDILNGPKWPLLYTLPDLQKNLIDRFELEDGDRFDAFGHCIFGLVNTYWSEVVDEIADRSNNNLDQAVVLYLEKVAWVKYLQNFILRWLDR